MNISNEELLEHLLRLEGLMHRYQSMDSKHNGVFGNPYRGQGRVLSILKMQPEITQKELGYLLDMRNQSLGELLSKLESKGYITRTPSQEDRRTMIINLTKDGEEAAYASEYQPRSPEKVFDILKDEERELFINYLDRLIENVEQCLRTSGIDETAFDHRFAGEFFTAAQGRRPSRKEFQDMMKERHEMLRKEKENRMKDGRGNRRKDHFD